MIQVIVEITHYCPCRCPFCTVPKSKKVMPLEHFRRALECFKEFFQEEMSVVISGGEPSVVDNLRDYVMCAKELGYMVTVATNAYNPSKVLEAEPDLIEVSLDYFGKKHDSVRGVKGLFDNAMKLVRVASGRVVIRSTAMRDNIADIISIRKYLDDSIPVIAMPVRGAPDLAPSPDQLEVLERHGVIVSDNCPAGVSSFVVDPDLNVLACIFYRKKLGQLRNFTKEELRKIVDEGAKIPRFPCEK